MSALIPRPVELETVDYLRTVLTEHVATETTSLDPETGEPAPTGLLMPMLRVDMTASYRRNMITDQAQISVQGYAGDPDVAERLTARAFAHLMGWPEVDEHVRDVEQVGGPAPFNDSNFPQAYRYQATVLISLRPTPTGERDG